MGADTLTDYVLPAGVPLIAVIEDSVANANKVLDERGCEPLDEKATYHLCRADGVPLDPQQSLDEQGVLNGESLWLLPTDATERFERVVEEVSTAVARSSAQQFAKLDLATMRRVGGWLLAGLLGWSELILARSWWNTGTWIAPMVSWSLTALLLIAVGLASRALDEQRRMMSDAYSWSAVLTGAAAAAMTVPGDPGGWHVLAAAAVVLVGATTITMLTGRYIAITSTLLTVGVFVVAVALIAGSGWHVRPERVAAAALIVVLALVTLVRDLGARGSGVPGPWFPSVSNRRVFEHLPGAAAKTVTPVATKAETPQQIAEWARRGTQTISGVLTGCAVVTVVTCRFAVVPGEGGGWRYLAYTLALCLVFTMRAQSFVDRYQSMVLAVSGVLGIAMVIGRYASASTPPPVATTLWCVAATVALAVACLLVALVLPKAKVNAPVRRRIELAAYVPVALSLPWLIWMLGLMTTIRNAVHGS
jgi:type VII secretion integral membrane protein EccD